MLEKLIEAAKNEDWDFVDQHIQSAVDSPEVVRWASAEIASIRDPNLADLAATIFAKTNLEVTDSDNESLEKILRTDDDSLEFARFRAACALVKHGRAGRDSIDALLEFTRHEETDLRPIANKFLAFVTDKQFGLYCDQLGYSIETGENEPGYEYTPHFHERTILKTLSGSITIMIDVGELVLEPGSYVVVHEKETHAAIVGPSGWKWQAAFSPKESKKYPGRH